MLLARIPFGERGPGDTTETVTVLVKGDASDGSNETFSGAQGVGKITDDSDTEVDP